MGVDRYDQNNMLVLFGEFPGIQLPGIPSPNSPGWGSKIPGVEKSPKKPSYKIPKNLRVNQKLTYKIW
jgi:hypothetical protein